MINRRKDSLNLPLYAAGNLVRILIKIVNLGIEYLWGQRINKNNDDGKDNRLHATAQLTF